MKKIFFSIFLVFVLMSASGAYAFTMESESYFMPTGQIDGAGTLESSSNYMLYTDLKQTTPVGTSESDKYVLQAGYIYTLFDDIYISNVNIDGKVFSAVTSISGKPLIEADIIDEYKGPGLATAEVYIDGKKYEGKLVQTSVSSGPAKPNKYHFSFSPSNGLSAVTHDIGIKAINYGGSSDYFKIGNVTPNNITTAEGKTMNVPNPFRPERGEGTTIIYNLTSATSVKLIIYDITGKVVWQRSFNPGAEGGKAGKNGVYWDGKNDFGEYVGNGVYIYLITSGSKIIHKGHMAVMD